MSEVTETQTHNMSAIFGSCFWKLNYLSWFMILLAGRMVVWADLAHHDPEGVFHVFQEVAGVGGNRTGPHTPHQREQPGLVNHPQVHRHVVSPQFPARYKHSVKK